MAAAGVIGLPASSAIVRSSTHTHVPGRTLAGGIVHRRGQR